MLSITANLIVHGGHLHHYSDEMQKEYVLRYNEIVDEANKSLERWNKDWDGIFSGTMKEDSLIWDVYGQFIAHKERMLCMINNLDHANEGSRIFMDCIPDKGNPMIIGMIDRNPDVYFELVPSVMKGSIQQR